MGNTQPGDLYSVLTAAMGLPTWLLECHTYFISSCTQESIAEGYSAMMLLLITHYITQKHLHWDTAVVLHRIAMQMILHSGLKLKETYLNDMWVEWMCGTCDFHGFCNIRWCVIGETIWSKCIPMPHSRTCIRTQIENRWNTFCVSCFRKAKSQTLLLRKATSVVFLKLICIYNYL